MAESDITKFQSPLLVHKYSSLEGVNENEWADVHSLLWCSENEWT